MKYPACTIIILFLLSFSVNSNASAIDTLTSRQIYMPLSVGDTFDFHQIYNNQFINHVFESYYRKILVQKTLCPSGDTLYLSFNNLHTLSMELDTIVDLDSIAISSQIAPDTNCHVFCAFDTTAYHGFVSNSIIFGCNLIETGWRFTKALGKTEIIQNDYDPFAGISETKTDVLIYYNNGTTIIGKPYYTYTSIQNISSMGLLNVWPNPFHSSLFLDIRSIKEDGTITIYNILGQSIYQKELRNSNTDPQILDLSLLQVGVYTLQIQTSKGNFIEKITKQ